MSASYQNVNVRINGTAVFATSASVSFQVPLEGVRALGSKKAIATIPNGPPQGTLDISFVVTNDPIGSIFSTITNTTSAYNGTSVSIGGLTYPNAYLTSHSLNGEANSIINGSASFTVFGPGGGAFSEGSAGLTETESIGHGSATTIPVTKGIGFDYSANIEWQPLYLLGTSIVNTVIFSSASQTLTLRGNNIGRNITECANKESVSFSIGSICGGAGNLATVSIQNGRLQSSETSVQAGGFVEGNYVITKNF